MITAAPFVLAVAVGVAVLVRRWFVLSGAIALFFLSYLAVSAVGAETSKERNRFLAAAGFGVVGAIALVFAPDRLQETALYCLAAVTSILSYLLVKDWDELNEAFRVLFAGAGGLAGLAVVALLLALVVTGGLGSALSVVGVFVAKLAIALFITLELGRLQFR